MKLLGSLMGALFGLLFAGAGIFIALETAVPTFQSWQTMQHWHSTSATLLSLRGKDNDTLASYRYVIDGRTYENDRVYVATTRDNIGSYHKKKYQELYQLKQTRQPVTIWYDPANPADSVIDRNMRWGLFVLMTSFCSFFILIGLAVVYGAITYKPDNNKDKKISLTDLRKAWNEKCEDPGYEQSFLEFVNEQKYEAEETTAARENAWLDKKEWRNNRIRSEARSTMWGAWFFAIIWNAVSFPILFFLDDELKKGNYVALIGLLFPIVGIYLIKIAWNRTREWRRYGVIEFVMDPFPGSIGGHVGGTLHLINVDAHDAKYKIDLECVYTYMSGSGDSRSRKENIKWFESGYTRVVPTLDGIDLRFRFDVPNDLPEADIDQTDDYYFWRLKVSADIPGIDLEREYNIPVYQTVTESSDIHHNISAQVEELKKEKAEDIETALAQGELLNTALVRSLRFNDEGNEVSFYFPMFRNKVLTVFALIFGGGFGFATIMMNQSFADGGIMSIVMLVFSIPFALVGLIGTIAAIYLPFNNLSILIAERKIKAVRRLLFIPIKRSVASIEEIKDMSVEPTGSTGQGSAKIKHFKIIVHTKDNHKFTVAEDVDGKELAEQFKDYIYDRLNMSF